MALTVVHHTQATGGPYTPTGELGNAEWNEDHDVSGTLSADDVTDGTTNKAYSATEKTKLAGVATGATANSSDATLLARANHTGTQLAATISDFSAAADARVALGANPKNVVTVVKTDTFSTTSTSFTDLTGLSVSVTPSSASNRILIMASIAGATSLTSNKMFLKFLRGSTDVLLGDTASSRTRTHTAFVGQNADNATLIAIDSPATTSATTYKVQCAVSAGTGYVNRDQSDTDAATTGRYASSIVAMEIV